MFTTATLNKLSFHRSADNNNNTTIASIQQRRVALNKRPPLLRSASPTLCTGNNGLHRTSSNASINSNSSSNRIVLSSSSSTRHHKPKKSVRFCDNASLESVRLFLKSQMPKACRSDPICPKHYTYRLRLPNWSSNGGGRSGTNNGRIGNAVRMESIQLDKPSQKSTVTLMGTVQVANLAFEKHVLIRYTLDDWATFQEVEANYQEPIAHSADTWDRFCFTIELYAPQHHTHKTLYLAVHYAVAGRDFWDNNDHKNYEIDIVPDVQLQLPSNEFTFSSSDDDDDDDDDENTFEIDDEEEEAQPMMVQDKQVDLLENQLKPLSLKDDASKTILFHPEQRQQSIINTNGSPNWPSSPLSPTTPADTSPLWIGTLLPTSSPSSTSSSSSSSSITTAAGPTTYFMNQKKENTTSHPDVMTSPTSHQFHALISNYCFYSGGPNRTSVYSYHSSPPRCPSSPTPRVVLS
ncbi:putative phosphatase regulatory subunit-domain-containing protein [Cokeromyces recurvatus]|uniref:putative phosphatase regulatory subunit-domain-containing protein n=1 Tax=Cokeromyces recurvatus TaxID=90255 RepID=UPI00221EEA83|nr:putative phosphatase regulatory subunit-domain-containing protein [Cokeromyces recurvatus]KAI7900990.1 putative phosphatase regulatory subunit-domain-containing protein [Cokeromyces recurvatus]